MCVPFMACNVTACVRTVLPQIIKIEKRLSDMNKNLNSKNLKIFPGRKLTWPSVEMSRNSYRY